MDRGTNMNRMKRNLEENDDDQPERKRPALARFFILFSLHHLWFSRLFQNFSHLIALLRSVIVEAMKVDSLQKLCSSLEPIFRRVVSSSFYFCWREIDFPFDFLLCFCCIFALISLKSWFCWGMSQFSSVKALLLLCRSVRKSNEL